MVRLKIHFIVNPRSGRAAKALDAVRAFARRHGAGFILTERSRHAAELARRALDDGTGLIVAVGGDGTMNEVATTLVDTPATLGLIPCGSGDGLGRHLGIHGPLDRALNILISGETKLIDTGTADGHAFFTAAGLGFEAEISARFNQLTERGFLRYLTTSARAWRQFKPFDCTIEHDGRRETRHVFTLAVSNSDQYGNNARIAPHARVDDGLIDLTAVSPFSLIGAVPLAARLFTRKLERGRGIWRATASRFVVERPEPGLIHTDGETHHAGPRVEFSIRPRSLLIKVPAVKIER